MCGIVGAMVFESSGFRLDPGRIVRMRDTMVHRGPDGAGVWVSPDRTVGLGHRRLSIVDLSTTANQPMGNEDGSVQIIFNGEIYNHAEIRKELVATGRHRWRTDHSDTEVIVHAFEEWGIDCLERFRGMFAIAIWDARTRELWLVRDRIGIKPLYYSLHHGRITFASEIKALLADPEQPRRVNEQALYHYLTFLATPAPDTLFDGIRKLPGGTWLRVREDGTISERKYWDVWEHTTPLTGVSENEIAERVLSELRTAVTLRKVSDVPVGVFLSGGIDSSTNVALFSEGERSPVKTFSIGYEGDYDSYRNELHYARKVAEKFGADHHERLLNQNDLIEFLPEMVRLQDEPLADPVCVPVYYVSKLARDNGIVVAQVGEGADELFWGYPTWKLKLRLQHADNLPVPRFVKQTGLAALAAAGKDQGHPYEALRRSVSGQPVFWGGADCFTDAQKHRVLSPRLRRSLSGLTSWEPLKPIWDRFQDRAWDKSPLSWMSYVDLNVRLPELLLMRVDKMSMGVSLEGRVPFLDHRFVELAMSIPPALKTRDGVLKYVLKKAVRGVIPDEVIDRPKQGFGVPVYEWMFDRLGDYARKELVTFCGETDLLDPAEVTRLIETRQGSEVWTLLNLSMWWSEFIAGDSTSVHDSRVPAHAHAHA
ncbi:MAG: asparagine synthase (glutamine-hydrolyzing) [Acidobacteriota bacterium]